MERHVKNYLEAMIWDGLTYLPCEDCGKRSIQDIHHVEPRSKFGSTMKHLQDAISNLIGLCRDCHDAAHGPRSREIKERHKEIESKPKTNMKKSIFSFPDRCYSSAEQLHHANGD